MEDASRDNQVLTVLYEKSLLARTLEEKYNISFDPVQKTSFDNFFFLRVCEKQSIIINSFSTSIINTGIQFQLTHPRMAMRVDNYSNLLYEKNIGILNNYFDFNFTKPIHLLVYNYSNKEQLLLPGEIIASIKFVMSPEIHMKLENSVVLSSSRDTKDNNWTVDILKQQKEKSSLNVFNLDNSKNYSRDTIINLTDGRLK